jgi:Caspase domain
MSERYKMLATPVLSLLLFLTATAFGDQTVLFNSAPSGATVVLRVEGLERSCVTPCKVRLADYFFDPAGGAYETASRLRKPIAVTITKDGYKAQIIELTEGPFLWDDDKKLGIEYYYVPQQKKSPVATLERLPDYDALFADAVAKYRNGETSHIPSSLRQLKGTSKEPYANELAAKVEGYTKFMDEGNAALDGGDFSKAQYSFGSAKRFVEDSPVLLKQVQDRLDHATELGRQQQGEKLVSWDIQFAETIPDQLMFEKELQFNDWNVQVQTVNRLQNTMTVLGPDTPDFFRRGLNTFAQKGENLKEAILFWREKQELERFKEPYRNSFAIIAAIDDYDRVRDKEHRGKTKLQPLGGMMVKDAKELKETLMTVGFPEKHIMTLFDEEATSKAINDALLRFWVGHELASADRVFFYFGGHGTQSGQSVLLVTYDYNPEQPTTSTILVGDLTGRQSENIVASHVLFALDSCHAGLALKLGNSYPSDEDILRFHQLVTIRADTDKMARNVLVAGTGNQDALFKNGGIFTRALVDGLKGAADLNHDRLIQFDELVMYVRARVRDEAARTSIRQDPEGYVLSQFGPGKVLFILEPWQK